MKILLMPNPLKGSLSSGGFCLAAQKALKNKAHIACLPVADGGDGLIDVFKAAYPSAREYKVTALNAVYKKQKAPYLILPDKKTCIIETAKVCGLGSLKKSELMVLKATSYGVGSVIKAAAAKGARRFYIGLGGVGCNDGGAGMARALGYKLLNKNGAEIDDGAEPLLTLAKIGPKPAWLRRLDFYGLSDVKNPLLGPLGSAKVYGPQKGASAKDVIVLEKALTALAKAAKKDLKKNINIRRCGAAGAIASGLYGFLDAKLIDGGPFVFEKIKAAAAVKKCDIVITAEGKLDAQTFYGKAPQLVCSLALKYKKPLIFICGVNEIKNRKFLEKKGITRVIELSSAAGSAEASFKNPGKYLKQVLSEAVF